MAAPYITESESIEPSLCKYPPYQKHRRPGGSASGLEATIPSRVKAVDSRLLVKPGGATAIAIALKEEFDFHSIIPLSAENQSFRA